jgi:hypothetical protein
MLGQRLERHLKHQFARKIGRGYLCLEALMQDYHLKVGDAEHRCTRGVLSSNVHIVNLSLAVVLRVNTQLLISLSLSEVEDTSLKTLRIGPITIQGV